MRWALPLVLYGSLAMAALALVWRDRCVRPVGVALAFNFVASNLAFFMVAVEQRPGVFTMTEVLLSTVAYIAWLECRARAMILLVAVSALSICANVAFAATQGSLYAYNVATNVLFVAECLVIAGIGIASRVGDCGVGRWPVVRRWFAQPDAARQAEVQ